MILRHLKQLYLSASFRFLLICTFIPLPLLQSLLQPIEFPAECILSMLDKGC